MYLEIFIFVVVIVALILVHELGHFFAAKVTGMRVDEFGVGYPPRALTLWKKGGTEYTLNWVPFGGFVKILGEDASAGEPAAPDSFVSKNRFAQAFVLVAGVAMNMLFAYVLITGALVAGTPRALEDADLARAQNVELVVSNVLPGSPADRAGLTPGDSILRASDGSGTWESTDSKSFSAFIAAREGSEVTLLVRHEGAEQTLRATPAAGVVPSDPSRAALGVEVGTIGVLPLSFLSALREGAVLTWGTTVVTAKGLWHFFAGVFTFSADLSQVSGPVGIAGIVGGAATSGLGNLLSIIAVISINLAIINLLPIPALDGGRLLFVLVEGIVRRPIPARVTTIANSISFALLILLMVVITAHDIFKIVG